MINIGPAGHVCPPCSLHQLAEASKPQLRSVTDTESTFIAFCRSTLSTIEVSTLSFLSVCGVEHCILPVRPIH